MMMPRFLIQKIYIRMADIVIKVYALPEMKAFELGEK